MVASEEIELFCFIIGDKRNCIFPIQIAKDQTVGNMKAKIKEGNKHMLRSVDARCLMLWMVDKTLDSAVDDFIKWPPDDSDREDELVSWRAIADYWPSQPSRGRLHVIVQLPSKVAKRTNKLLMILRSPAFRGSVFGFIPWIAALYFFIKSLQASAAQAYASLLSLNDRMPKYMPGYVTNVSTSDNLKSFGDMVNFRAAYIMLIFTAVVLGLVIFGFLLFGWISAEEDDSEIAT